MRRNRWFKITAHDYNARMGLLNSPVLLSAGWVLAIAAVTVLWIVAMLDIKGHLSKETFTVAQLASMAAAVSVMAGITLATLNAAFPASWTGIGGSNEPYSGSLVHPKCKGVRGTFVFSFGLEQPSYASPSYASFGCPSRPIRDSAA